MNLKYYNICIIMITVSCNNNMKDDLLKLCSTPIFIPNSFDCLYNGKDTIISSYYNDNKSTKLIIYTDSNGCTSCSINKMDLWKPYTKYADTYNGRLKVYFIFSPSKNNSNLLRIELRNNPFDYPVLVDGDKDFEKLNPHLPKNKIFHTFLLDENNKVILVGDPRYNKEIEKLFYKITQELLAK